jgi:hypothetical protein
MYFPYLYDKQSELLALRRLAGNFGAPQKIVPVVEPINAARGLERLYDEFRSLGDVAYVVVNPHQQSLADFAALATWRTATASSFADTTVFRPTFKEISGTTAAELAAFVSSNTNRPIGVILTTGQLPVAAVAAALAGSDYLVFATVGADRVALTSTLGAARVVEVNDRFPAQRTNADYSGEEWFSRDHMDYAMNGHVGFSDYTVLPAKPSKRGGGAPGAVAVHLTYEATGGDVWIQHFVSDETDRSIGTAGVRRGVSTCQSDQVRSFSCTCRIQGPVCCRRELKSRQEQGA